MSDQLSFVISNKVITCNINNELFSFTREHPFFNDIKVAIDTGDIDRIKLLSNTHSSLEMAVSKIGEGKVAYKDGDVLYNGRVLHTSLTNRIVEMAKDGFSITNLINFLENLMQNPSRSSVEELYDFLENKNIPITSDGCFLAYKAVCGDYYDKHSRTILNTVGSVVEMPRNQVDDDRRRECSYGYHVGALEYSGPNGYFFNAGDRCMIVKVNPKDVVAVPKDYNCQKMRVCRYEVHGEYEVPLNHAVYGASGEKIRGDIEEDFSLDTDDLVCGDTIDFTYIDSSGNVTERYGVLVDKLDYIEDYMIGIEYDDEDNTQVRRFKLENMSNVYYSE